MDKHPLSTKLILLPNDYIWQRKLISPIMLLPIVGGKFSKLWEKFCCQISVIGDEICLSKIIVLLVTRLLYFWRRNIYISKLKAYLFYLKSLVN